MRKPIAISAKNYEHIVSCDDGSIWEFQMENFEYDSESTPIKIPAHWKRLPDIPQEDSDGETK